MSNGLASKDLMPNDLSKNKCSVCSVSDSVNGLVFGALLAVGLGHAPAASAHGTVVEVTQTAVAGTATFDNGEPMTDAQVLVYSPGNLETPWQKGQTDAEGRYLFAPEAGTPGAWEVTVRKAGHGGTTTFAVGSAEAAVATSTPTVKASTPVQKWLSMAAIVWGFVGTALFFSRRSSTETPALDPTVLPQPVSNQPVSNQPVSRTAADPVSVSGSSGGQH